MTVAVVGIAVRSIRLIHIVVTVVGLHHRRIVYVSQVPLVALGPSCNAAVVVSICRCLPLVKVGGGLRCRGKRDIVRVFHLIAALDVSTDMIGCACLQSGQRDIHVLGRPCHLHVVDGGISRRAVAHTTTCDSRTCGSGRNHRRRRSDCRHYGSRYRQRGASPAAVIARVVVATGRQQQYCAQQYTFNFEH